MRTPAEVAIENAISFEVKKDAMRQRQNGDWVLSLTLQAIDMHPRVTAAKMGTIYLCTLVEKNDDETPVDHVAMDRDKWRGLGPVKQTGIRCKDPVFWAWMREALEAPVHSEQQAAENVRRLCHVLTRSDLSKPGFSDQRILWFDLDKKFQAWRALQNV